MSEEQQLKVLQKIIDIQDLEKGCRILPCNFEEESEIKQGQFIFALHPFSSVMQCVGYAVQIRKKVGQFGSDIVLIRLANGRLQAWENQGFFSMSDEQEVLARQIFIVLPEDEDYSHGYTTHDKIHETGFLVKDSESTESPSSANVNITISNSESSTHIAFI